MRTVIVTERSMDSTAQALRSALRQEMKRDDSVIAYGEGINDPNGFFGTTSGLNDEFPGRVLDVPNSEESLLGFGVGLALAGMRPVFVNLRVEFLLLAMNQLVNIAAKWSAMTPTEELPLTVRAIVGKGWGQGAQHSGVYGAVFAHIPGLDVGVASTPLNAASLLVTAIRNQRPSIVIEPKAIYLDEAQLASEIRPGALGRGVVARAGNDFTVIAVGDGVVTALEAARAADVHGVSVEVLDLQWMSPLDAELIQRSAGKTGRVGVLDIGWSPYGLAAEVARVLLIGGSTLRGRLLDWAPISHAPAGCFAEADHYPEPMAVAGDIVRAVRVAHE